FKREMDEIMQQEVARLELKSLAGAVRTQVGEAMVRVRELRQAQRQHERLQSSGRNAPSRHCEPHQVTQGDGGDRWSARAAELRPSSEEAREDSNLRPTPAR